MRFFNIAYDKVFIKHLCYIPTGDGCLIEQLLRAELALCQNEIRFFAWKQLWLFRLNYLADTFSKKNEVNLSLQGKQLTVFVANDKIWAFKLKSELWKHVSTTINLTASQCRPPCKMKMWSSLFKMQKEVPLSN